MYNNLRKFAEDNGLQLSGSFEHGRYKDGKVSITELLSIFVDPGFEYVKTYHADKLKAACERGTRIHENLEKETNRSDPFYRRWREWKLCHDITIISREKTYYRDEVRGSIDACIESPDLTGPVDYKSSLRKNEKYRLQVTGYCWLTGYTQAGILYLDKDKYIYDEVDVAYYMPIFEELVEYSRTIIAINPHQENDNEERGYINDTVCKQIQQAPDFWSNSGSKCIQKKITQE